MRVLCLALVVSALIANAQTRRHPNSGSSIAGAYNMPSATMHGALKKITGKDIIITVEGDQDVTIDRTRKTKFLKAGKEIKPADIAAGSIVTIDVNQDPQLKPLALNVTVDSGPTESEPSPPAMTSVGSGVNSSAAETAPTADSKSTPAKPAEVPSQ